MDARDAAARWVEAWTRGWSALDPAPILSLYADDAFFRSHPFREPEPAAAYVRRVLAEEESAEFEFAEPIVDGDRAAVEYAAQVRLRSGGLERFAGVSLIRFDDRGFVVEQRDVWTPPLD